MKLSAVPLRLQSGDWYILKVEENGNTKYFSELFTLKDLNIGKQGLKVIKYKDPRKFQSMLTSLIVKFRWYGKIPFDYKIKIINQPEPAAG